MSSGSRRWWARMFIRMSSSQATTFILITFNASSGRTNENYLILLFNLTVKTIPKTVYRKELERTKGSKDISIIQVPSLFLLVELKITYCLKNFYFFFPNVLPISSSMHFIKLRTDYRKRFLRKGASRKE